MTERGRLNGKVCVVAGCGGAIGGAVAARFVAEGAVVVGIDRQEHEVGAIRLTADLSREPEVRGVLADAHRAAGRIDVLYNNAGLVSPEDRSVLDTPTETLDSVFDANFRTTWLCCKYGVPYLLKNDPPGGVVINTGSFLADMGSATAQMAYNAAKAAVMQLTRDLGVNLGRRGVRVNALALGPIETPQLTAAFSRAGEAEARRRFTHMPLGRFGTLDELAGTAAYLASDDAGFVTASVFPIDGGIRGAFTIPN